MYTLDPWQAYVKLQFNNYLHLLYRKVKVILTRVSKTNFANKTSRAQETRGLVKKTKSPLQAVRFIEF